MLFSLLFFVFVFSSPLSASPSLSPTSRKNTTKTTLKRRRRHVVLFPIFNLMLKVKETYILFRWFEFFSSSSSAFWVLCFADLFLSLAFVLAQKNFTLSSRADQFFFLLWTVELNFFNITSLLSWSAYIVCGGKICSTRLSMCMTKRGELKP